jgi:hypothetical protein
LFVDNRLAHIVSQPLDQAVFRSLKCHFGKLKLLRMIEYTEKEEHTVTLLMQFGMLTKLAGISLRKPAKFAFIMQELQQGQEVTKTTTVAAPGDDYESNGLAFFEWACKVDTDILASYDLDVYVGTDDFGLAKM